MLASGWDFIAGRPRTQNAVWAACPPFWVGEAGAEITSLAQSLQWSRRLETWQRCAPRLPPVTVAAV